MSGRIGLLKRDRGRRDGASSRITTKLLLCAAGVLTVSSVAITPSAGADAADILRSAVAAARGSACGPLRPDPMIDQAAAAINKTTNRWIDNSSRAVPETDALPLLKELGYGGNKATILSSAATTDVDAIKAVLVQGYAKIPDCSFSEYGVSTLHNAKKNLTLTTVVLAA